MNAPVDVDARLGIIDCDIHPYMKPGALNQYLPERWRNHVVQYGKFNCGIYADRGTYPRFSPNTSRRDSPSTSRECGCSQSRSDRRCTSPRQTSRGIFRRSWE